MGVRAENGENKMCEYVFVQDAKDSEPKAYVRKKKLDIAIDALANLRNCNAEFNSPTALNNYVDGVLEEIRNVSK